MTSSRLSFRELLWPALMLSASTYLGVTALRGADGLYRQIEVEAAAADLRVEKAGLEVELAALRNRTKRLSDDWLDLDLLDQQARDVLGYLRPDEIVIR